MKVILAYSGGLDTSVLLKWLQETYKEEKVEVICFCADVGQEEELDGLHEKAAATGASKCYVDDLTEEFARDFVYPMLQANAIYEGLYLLGTSIARPLIAKRMIEIANAEGAEYICHGATGKGNDQVRFELTAYAMKPDINIIAPWRMPEIWKFTGRTDMMEYAKEQGIPVLATAKKPYSMDRNLLHISFEGGILEDPWAEAPDEMFCLTQPLSQTPDEAEYIVIGYEKGDAVTLNGEALSPAKLMKKLNTIAGKHGVGRIDIVENRFVGMKSRGVYETPAGTVLLAAHRALETITLDREVIYQRDRLIPDYARMIYNGFWYAPEREALQAMITETQKNVTGEVRLKLFKGGVHVVGRRSPYSLYNPELCSFEQDNVYNQGDATGFIKLNALRLRVRAQAEKLQDNK